ncbi:Hypothetical protein, putative [Bodo saltans]|uniref:ubiquitinyl hydrolase 1 n=1 Tax=Bodo saltans TaxID=75058 RepID=A0A0S4J0K7_BODSA|nr:Hypothetical protein, putative [Bodo saltans]|eukprot:CUF98858.1 Hypothetical protein, putative [Bodo saltans]
MADPNDTLTLLVPRFEISRRDQSSPFSVDVVVHRYSHSEWYGEQTSTKYYLYPVHISQMFLFTPSYSSAVYLLLLRYLNRNYTETYRLVASVGTDEEIEYDVKVNLDAVMGVRDQHPDAIACMARMTLYVGGRMVPWDVATLVAHHVRLQSRTSVSCLMPPEEELRLVELAWQGEERVRVMRTVIKQNSAMLDGQRKRGGHTNEIRRLAQRVIREELGTRLEDHKIMTIFDKAMGEPLAAFDRCLVVNRRLLLLAEHDLLFNNNTAGTSYPSKVVNFEVPVMPEDRRLLFYRDYDPSSISTEATERWLNDQGKPLTCSGNHDYYYCSVAKREMKCRCGFSCREMCGGHNKDGCPCLSCERFNKEKRNTIRFLPLSLDNKNSVRPIPFAEISTTMKQIFAAFLNRVQHQKGLPEPCHFHSEQISLRNPIYGFYMLYEMCTGSRACKIGKRSIGKELVQLLLPLYADGTDVASAFSHMIQYISRLDKEKLSQLPQFTKKVRAIHPIEVQEALMGIIAETDANGEAHPLPPSLETMPKYSSEEDKRNDGIRSVVFQPRRLKRDASIPLAHTRILPAPLNCDCAQQVVELPVITHLQLRGEEQTLLTMQQSELGDLTGWPLKSILGQETSPLIFRNRAQLDLAAIDSSLPFDLSVHPDATMSVAREMLERLTHEMSAFAKRSNDAQLPKMAGLETEREVRHLLRAALGVESSPSTDASLKQILRALDTLKDGLLKLRKSDNKYVAYANEVVLRTANYYSHQTLDGLVLTLRSIANREPHLKMEYLLSALCSTTCTEEWLQLNPFLTPQACVAMKQAMVVSVLRANRAGHINRVLEVLRELQSLFHRAEQLTGSEAAISHLDAFVASVSQKADTLASLLAVKKCYFTAAADVPNQTTPDSNAVKVSATYDPRHLLFEFTWNLMMRKRQYELIGDMYGAVTRGESVVKQMIMGAGKTTVVSPVLGLMLANGRQLMVQIVPPALLDFTRAVLRTTFSSILQKQIFTFLCDRNTSVDSDIQAKFEEAIQSRGIVLTTPSSVKSLFLKCVESCRRATQPSLPPSERQHLLRDTKDHLQILDMWRDAVLVMDEVDMLLHPLKSELNFPIGAKRELDFQPIRWKLPIHLLDIIYSFHTRRLSTHMRDAPETPAIVTKFREAVAKGLKQNVLQEMPHLILLNAPFYEAELKPILIDWLMLFVKAQHLAGLTDEETKNYMYQRPTKKKEPELVAKIEALDPYHIKVLNLSFEWINSYLPHILQKIDRVTFGIMTQREYYDNQNLGQSRSRLVTAIPFVGKDMPSPSSEFAHPDIVIGMTVLAYRYEGLRETDFHLIMQEIFAAVEREVGRFSQRRTTILYNRWVGAAGGNILTTFDYQATRAKFFEELADDGMGLQPSESLCLMSDGLHHGMELNYCSNEKEESMVRLGSVVLSPEQRNVLPLKLMKQANELEMEKLFKLFRRTPEVIHWYLTEHIFPEHMRHQEVKLSASGQELGGDMLFQRRIGFSGTPSSLLPVELGQCGYEVGTDGQLIHTLTSPEIMSHLVMGSGWNVRTILDVVASANPPFHALIDTGALITGMSNLQVAQYLLKTGLPQMEGVVYLDEEDRKMILVRATNRSLPLSECGIPKVKRFAFYDQIHTTGMDIDHTPNAQAVQTLGKDMTFRDFSQGAYRMRGIGQGQTIHLLIIPEVEDLIFGVMKSVKGFNGSSMKDASSYHVLVGVTAWLMVNSIRSEHTQHNQLRVQCCSNVWRKEAFRSTVKVLSTYDPTVDANGAPAASDCLTEVPKQLSSAVQVFDEVLDYQVISIVPQPRMFSEMLIEHVDGHDEFITGAGKEVIASIIDSSRREDEMDAPVIDVEMVQEQEEEREREEQKEQEEEIEIEKFVDHDYSRESESSMPWRIETLRSLASGLHQFYPLRDFHLFKRNSLQFPEHILLSRNYYSTKWTGYRRIKNVVVTMEWIPDTHNLLKRSTPSLDYGDLPASDALVAVRRTLTMLLKHQSKEGSNDISEATIKSFIQTALQFADTQATSEWSEIIASLKPLLFLEKEELYAAVLHILNSNALRHEEDGRHTVAVTLGEAETLRRILHFRKARKSPIIEGSRTEFALHIVPGANALLDQTHAFVDLACNYQRIKHFQCLRYFDGDLQYTDAEVGLLLRALHVNTQGARKLFFHQTISCRRRARQRWDRSPIATVFLLQSALVLLHQRTVGLCMQKDVVELHELALPDAFLAFNSSGTGVLSPEELWGAMRFCRLDLLAEDVLDFIDIADAQREGTVQYPDFLYMLSGSRDTEDDAEEQQAKNLPNVVPYGTGEISVAQNERNLRLRMEEEVSSQALADEERRVMDEIEQENIRVEMNILQTFTNPHLETKKLTFDLGSETQVAQLTSTVDGVVARQVAAKCPSELAASMLCNESAIRCSLRGLLNILQPDEFNQASRAIDTFTLTAEFCLPKMASYESTRRDIMMLANGVVQLTLAQWQLPYCCYTSSGNKPAVEITIAEQIKARRVANGETEEEEVKHSSKTPITMIFSSAIPSLDNFLGYLTAEASQYLMMANAKRQTIIVHESSYEYGLLDDSRFPKGWICCKYSGETYVHPLVASITLLQDRLQLVVTTGEPPGPPYGRIQSTDCDPEANARGSTNMRYYNEDDDEDEEEEIEAADGDEDAISAERGRSRVFGDLEDLMFAIRRLRQLSKGDRVRRHPKYWQQEDADGGEGSIGKVTAVGEDHVDVLWPNQNTTSCSWGRAGIFEIVKIPKEAYAQPDRKPDNDERHREIYIAEAAKGPAKAGRYPCTGCGERFILKELLVCNECTKPVYLCDPCFKDGQHETHEFTALKCFDEDDKKAKEGSDASDSDESSDDERNKSSKKKNKKGMPRADSEEKGNLGPLFDFGSDEDICTSAPAAPKGKVPPKVEKVVKEEKPKDPNIVTESLSDVLQRAVGVRIGIGSWVRTRVRLPPSVKKHQLGFVVGQVNDTNVSVMFLSEYLNDAKVTQKSVAINTLAAVKPFVDPTYGANTIESTPNILAVAQSHFSPGLWLLTEAARARSRFEVGSSVKVDTNGEVFYGVVAAVLPKDRYMIFPQNGAQRYIFKSVALTLAYHKGDNVRFRRSVTYPAKGWPGIPIGQRYTAQFRVSGFVQRGSQVALSIEGANVKCEADSADLEIATESKWMIYRGQGSRADLLPNSCRIIIDRAHNEGKRFVRFTFGKKLFRVDFPSNQLVLESTDGFAGEVQGSLVRYPPMQWARPTRVLAIDDGAWHVMSVIFSGNSITALCDGKSIPLDIDGHCADRFKDQRCRTDASISMMQEAKQPKKHVSKNKKSKINDEEDDMGFDLFGDDDDTPPPPPVTKREESITLLEASDDSDNDEGNAANAEGGAQKAKVFKGPTISEMVALQLSKPVAFFGAECSSSTNFRMYTAPQRFVTKLLIAWEANSESVQALHAEALLNGKWSCSDCGHSNPRTYLTCDECNVSRKVHQVNKLLNSKPQRRFRYAMLRSSEASTLRLKLSNKLRTLFQAQLDEIQAAVNNEGEKHQDEDLTEAL